MRIIHLVNHCSRGGNVHAAVDLACNQSLKGDDVVYGSEGGKYEGILERYGVRHEFLAQNLRRPRSAVRSVAKLIAFCRMFEPDLLHAHMMSGAVIGYVASRVLGMPLVNTVHNSFDKHSRLMRLGDRVVAVSHAERDLLLKQGYRPDRLHVVLNGQIGTPRDELESSHPGIQLERPCVSTICGLERRKGVHDIIKAFHIVAGSAPAWHLHVVGDGPERYALEEQSRQCGLGARTHFLGHVDNPKAIFASTDIFVLASYAEPWGLAIVEAREAGCAIIGSSVGGIVEQLRPDCVGQLFEPGDADGLAKQLGRLMTNPGALLAAQKQAKKNLEYFNVARVVRDYASIYDVALRTSSRAASSRHRFPTSPSGVS